MWVCEDVKMWVKMWGCEDVKMWRWEDVKMRRCEVRRCEVRRCEDERMWRCEDEKMRYRPHYWKNPALRRSREKKQTTRCTKHRQAPKKTKKQKFQQLLRSGPLVPGNFSVFFWCLCRFGASSGLFFFWCLCRFGDSDFTKHWQAPKKTKKTNH